MENNYGKYGSKPTKEKNNIIFYKIAVIVLILIVLAVILAPKLLNKYYNKGVVAGQYTLANLQTQTGNIYIVVNGTIKGYSLNEICYGGSQGSQGGTAQ